MYLVNIIRMKHINQFPPKSAFLMLLHNSMGGKVIKKHEMLVGLNYADFISF